MFRTNITDAEFILEINKVDWALVDPMVLQTVAANALIRQIDMVSMPRVLQEYCTEMKTRCLRYGNDDDVLQWMQEHNDGMTLMEYCQAITDFTSFLGAARTAEDEQEEIITTWFWLEDGDEYRALLTHYGLFFDGDAGLSPRCYHLIGYCVANEIPWVTPILMNLENMMADTSISPTQH